MKTQVTIALVLALVVGTSNVATAGDKELAMRNLIDEQIECAAYWSFVAEAMRRSDETALENAYQRMFNKTVELVFKEAELVNVSQNAVLAKLDMSLKLMADKTDSHINNISVIINDYAEPCQQLYYEKIVKR